MTELKLRDYQQQHLLFHLAHDRSYNCLRPGRGKTPIMCVYTQIQWDAFKIKSCWVMPTALLTKNRDELLKWSDWDEKEVVILTGPRSKREKIYADPKVKTFMMSGDMYAKEWRDLPDDVNAILVDEIHSLFGNHESARTKSFYVSSRRFKKFLLCSGTPVAGKYSSIYPSVAVIEPRYYVNYTNFLHYHAIFDRFNHIQGWRNGNKIGEILKRISSGVEDPFEGRKDLKEIIFEKCNFDEKQKAAYKEIEETSLLELDDEFIDVRDSGGVKAIRCRQILSCPEKIGLKVDQNGKDEMLKIHLQNAKDENERIVIFSPFVAEQERIKALCDSMGVRSEIMNGSTAALRRGEIDKAFRDHEIDVIIGSPKVASMGWNWEYAKECVFTNLSYDNTEFEQSWSRLSRGSRTRPLLIYILDFGTRVEKRILQILMRKNKELKKLFDNEIEVM